MATIPSTGKRRNFIESLNRNMNAAYWGESPTGIDPGIFILNGDDLPSVNAAGTALQGIVGLDTDPNVPAANNVNFKNGLQEIAGEFQNPADLKTVNYDDTLNASIGTTTFFVADRAYTVTAISYVQKTQGTSAGAVCSVTKDTGTKAPGTGVALQTGTFDCHGTVNNTVVNGTLTTTTANLTLAAGDRLAVLFAGTLTTLAGVTVTVTLTPSHVSETAQYYVRVNGDVSTQTFFVANRDMVVTNVNAIFATAFATSTTLDVTHETATSAPGAGTSVLSAAMNVAGTINTVLSPALTATASALSMAAGDRLSVKFSATTTGTGVCVTVAFKPIFTRKEVTWQLAPNAQQQVAQTFFIADRTYEIVDASCTYATAAGGAAKIAVTIDKGTTVPGGGNVVQTDNTNAGFDLNTTPNTVQFMTPASLHLRLLSPGDRLGLAVTGAAQSIAKVAITCSLRPNY